MKILLLASCLLAFAGPAIAGQREEAVIAAERARLKAFAAADKRAFHRLVAEELTTVHSNGELLHKADEQAAMRPFTPKNPLPTLGLEAPVVRLYGDTAILTGELVERRDRKVVLRLAFTNTYVRKAGQWRLVAGQLTKADP